MFTVMKCLGEGGLGQYQQSLHFHTSDNVARLLMVVNSSVNFLIYSCFSKSFQVNIKSNIQGKSKYRYLIKFPFSFRLLSLQRRLIGCNFLQFSLYMNASLLLAHGIRKPNGFSVRGHISITLASF